MLSTWLEHVAACEYANRKTDPSYHVMCIMTDGLISKPDIARTKELITESSKLACSIFILGIGEWSKAQELEMLKNFSSEGEAKPARKNTLFSRVGSLIHDDPKVFSDALIE